MEQIWTGKAAQVTARYGEHAPMAAVCCNACRACVTTNALGIAGAVATGAIAATVAFGRRIFAKPS